MTRVPDVLQHLLDSPRKRLIAAAVGGLVLIGGVALAIGAGGDDDVAATTTTSSTTTTVATTTTAKPTAVAPLTGLPIDPSRLGRVALVVKLDNVEPKARPQVGLNQADIVYEERVEGSVTRLLAVFHSTDVAPVGPVRSARTSDIAIFSPLHRPYFAWSGANGAFAARIRASNVADRGYDARSGEYFRDRGRPATSDLMLNSTATFTDQPNPGSSAPPTLFGYRVARQQTAHLEQVAGARISYGSSGGGAPVEYRWNGAGGWLRTQAGTPHVDSSGVQVAPANVIIQFVNYAPTDVGDQFGVPIPEAQLVGEGEVWVLTNGGLVQGRWQKPAIDAVTTYTDVDGQPILLTPGRTWVALPSPGGAARL